MARSLSPNFERRPSLDDIVEKYGSAKEAFERVLCFAKGSEGR